MAACWRTCAPDYCLPIPRRHCLFSPGNRINSSIRRPSDPAATSANASQGVEPLFVPLPLPFSTVSRLHGHLAAAVTAKSPAHFPIGFVLKRRKMRPQKRGTQSEAGWPRKEGKEDAKIHYSGQHWGKAELARRAHSPIQTALFCCLCTTAFLIPTAFLVVRFFTFLFLFTSLLAMAFGCKSLNRPPTHQQKNSIIIPSKKAASNQLLVKIG